MSKYFTGGGGGGVSDHGALSGLEDADHPVHSAEAGFEDDLFKSDPTARERTTIAFADTSRTLTVALAGTNTQYTVVSGEVIYTKNAAETQTIPDTEGLHYFYFDSAGALQSQLGFTVDVIEVEALVAVVYWDATNNEGIIVGDERHGRVMDAKTHRYLHNTVGARFDTGLALGNIVSDGNGDLDPSAQFSITNGVIWDEDLRTSITDGSPQQLSLPAQIPIYYRSGASGDWRRLAATNFPITTTGTGRAAWNDIDAGGAGIWGLSEVGNNDFVNMHYFASNDINNPVIAIMGQDEYPCAPPPGR